MKFKILIAEDDLTGRETLAEAFADRGYKPVTAVNGNEALAILKSEEIDLVVTDLVMPGVDGMRVLKEAVPICPVILITAHGTVDNAVDAMKLGAFDFVSKPIHLPHLFALVERALQMKTLTSENENLRKRVEISYDFETMIGRTQIMRSVFEQIKLVGQTETTVCILGESGTGKELVANAIHQHSLRSAKPFIKVNCAAISENLLESELFGHEKGSFTGAMKQRRGRFELADGGTLLLDEISEMSPSLQSKLLRILQEQEFERVGGTETLKVNVRIITASNADLHKRISEGTFREDLYYRISVFPIHLPPLRERRDDIPLIIDHFMRSHTKKMNKNIDGISSEVLDIMTNYDWPGNVRQLQNAVERFCVMTPENQIVDTNHLPSELITDKIPQNTEKQITSPESSLLPEKTMDQLEEMAIRQSLKKYGGNRAQTAKALDIGLKTLYRKIEKYGIDL